MAVLHQAVGWMFCLSRNLIFGFWMLENRMKIFVAFILVAVGSASVLAQGGPGRGRGFRGGRFEPTMRTPETKPTEGIREETPHSDEAHGGSDSHDARHDLDRQVFQYLLANHTQIRRSVEILPDGVETLTESDVPEIAAKLKEHVDWMKHRVEAKHPIRMRDPLFAEIFAHADKISLTYEETEHGVRVKETSKDAYVVKLIQSHAQVVTGFVERGFDEARKNHALPAVDSQETQGTALPMYPLIPKHGAVVPLPHAAHAPRDGAKLLIDVTRGGEPSELNPAIEKVAKYLHIYAAGGGKPAKARFTVILHGDATLAVLNHEAYSARFSVSQNPNLELLSQLQQHGVELFVCGQTLITKEAKPEEVADSVRVAVSALTVVVNSQQDGYAYVPLGK
jgi:uncharacterized protein